MLSQDSEDEFDQDLRLNLRYDFGKMNSTLGSVVPLAMFFHRKSQFNNNLLPISLKCISVNFSEMLFSFGSFGIFGHL